MTFVQEINPFTGILCVPYWWIWLLIVISWILSALESLFLRRAEQYKAKLVSRLHDLEQRANNEMLSGREEEIRDITIDGEPLPEEIITVILSMLSGQIDKHIWMSYSEDYIRDIYTKSEMLTYLYFVGPVLRVIPNFATFIIVVVRYADWYQTHESMSHWNKYLAFIVALFYIPSMKATGVLRWREETDYDDTVVRVARLMDLVPVCMFVAWFVIVSLPVFAGGIFIFVPTTLCFLLVPAVYGFREYLYDKCCYGRVSMDEEDCFAITLHVSKGPISLTLMWFLVSITMSTMEFYHGASWTEAYRVGFFAEYCNENDYFQFSKWDQYPTDIQFLIVCWLLF